MRIPSKDFFFFEYSNDAKMSKSVSTLRAVLKTVCVCFGLWLRGLGEGIWKWEGEGMGDMFSFVLFTTNNCHIIFDHKQGR